MGLEVDIARPQSDEFAPPRSAPMGEAHGERPRGLPEIAQDREEGLALRVVGERVAGHEPARFPLVLGLGRVAHLPHGIDVTGASGSCGRR